MACLSPKAHLSFMPFVTLIGLAIPMTNDQPLDLASFLALVLFPRVPRSNPSCLVQVQKLNIGPWLLPLLTYIGYKCSLRISMSLWSHLTLCGVTMLVRWPLLQTQFSMPKPNISKLITTSFMKMLLIKIWWFALFRLMIKLLIFLQRVYLLHAS